MSAANPQPAARFRLMEEMVSSSALRRCLFVVLALAFLAAARPAPAQDWFRVSTGLGVEKPRVAVADFAPKSDTGVGLANIRERLKVLYQGRAELIISVPPVGGTMATIKVPYDIAPTTT